MAKRSHIQTARFELRCSPEELARWRCAASEHGLSLASYFRVCLNRGPQLSRKRQADPALLRQVAAIGNNLNQIAFWANAYKSKQEAKPVEDGVKAVRQELAALLAEVGNDD